MSAIDKNETVGDKPISPEFRATMNAIANTIDEIFHAYPVDTHTGRKCPNM